MLIIHEAGETPLHIFDRDSGITPPTRKITKRHWKQTKVTHIFILLFIQYVLLIELHPYYFIIIYRNILTSKIQMKKMKTGALKLNS